MLESVLSAVVTALGQQGLSAVAEYPRSAAELSDGTLYTVGAGSCKCISSGLGDYLGVRAGGGGESDTELYGRRLELTLCIEAFLADESAETSAQTLISALPEGLRCESVQSGELRWDRELECLRREHRLQCTAFLLAESSGGDESEFLDFKLKGTIEHDD